MSASRGKNLSKKAALGYSQFGTGVLDQDDYDARDAEAFIVALSS